MSRAGFWKKDWFLGLVVAVVLFLLGPSDLLQSLERKAYDMGVRATDRAPSERIAVIAIDDASIANIGRWPWPRDVHAKLADSLRAGGAKVVGNLVSFSEQQLDPGLAYVNRLLVEYRKAAPDPQALVPGSLLPVGHLLLTTKRFLDAAFLKRALAKDADARSQSGAEFATALRAAAGSGVRAVPTVDLSL